MVVYSYCSYKASAVGFKIGRFVAGSKENEISLQSVPAGDKEASYIEKAFQKPVIQSMYGRIPGSGKYVVLVKNLEYSEAGFDGMGVKKYFNLAFQFDNGRRCQEFANRLYRALNEEKLKTVSDINSFVLIREENLEYGLRIHREAFEHWYNGILKNKMQEPELKEQEMERLNVTVVKELSQKDCSEKLETIFGGSFKQKGTNSCSYFENKRAKTSENKTKQKPTLKKNKNGIGRFFIVAYFILTGIAILLIFFLKGF